LATPYGQLYNSNNNNNFNSSDCSKQRKEASSLSLPLPTDLKGEFSPPITERLISTHTHTSSVQLAHLGKKKRPAIQISALSLSPSPHTHTHSLMCVLQCSISRSFEKTLDDLELISSQITSSKISLTVKNNHCKKSMRHFLQQRKTTHTP